MKKLLCKMFVAGFLCLSVIANSQYTWTQKANFPGAARASASCFAIGHYGYFGCGASGFNSNSGTYNDWWRWDQITNTWSAIASYPGAGQLQCTYFSIGDKGYVGLGCSNAISKKDLWRYDTTSNTWTQMAPFPGTARYGAYAFVIGTNAYIAGGNPGGPPYLSDCWKYNSLTNTWTQIATYPVANSGNSLVFSIGKYGYAGCGAIGNQNYMYKYDTASNSWTQVDSLSINGPNGSGQFVLGDTAYSVSGVNKLGKYIDAVFGYNPNTNMWNTLSNFSGTPRWTGRGFSIGNRGYIVSGYDSIGGLHNDLWQYGPVSGAGINDIYSSNNILLYPNPAQNEIYIQLNGNEKVELIGLYTITGQKLLEQKLNTRYSILNIQSISNGIYFLKVQMQDGSSETKKVEILR